MSGTVLAFAVAVTLTAVSAREHGRTRPPTSIAAIVIHAVGGPACAAGAVRFHPVPVRVDDAMFWREVLIGAPQNDAHFVIGRSGTLLSVIPTTEIANHTVGINDVSIGIELVNRGDGQELFGQVQIESLIELLREIRRQYPAISIQNIVAHSDIDQRTCSCGGVVYRRRQDPGANFPMEDVIKAVELPHEISAGPSLPRLNGTAPRSACLVEPLRRRGRGSKE
jgi:N-acetyl-anhydromuramyl-L-alanine amidase AmpD